MIWEIKHGIKSNFLSHVLSIEGMGTVHSVFENSFNLVFNGKLVHVGKAEEGLSAFGLLLDKEAVERILAQLQPNDRVRNQAGKLTLYGRGLISTLHYELFETVDVRLPENSMVEPTFLADLLERFESLSLEGKTGLFADSQSRQLLEAFVQKPLKDLAFQSRFIDHFIGRGIGLTPSGDDMLMGVLMACHVFESGADWQSILMERLALVQTTAVSMAYYQALLEGYTSSFFKAFMDALWHQDLSDWKKIIQNISKYGHTSGWDSLYGIYLYFKRKGEDSMSKKIVVALGGNAILTDVPTADAQKESLRETSEHLVSFVKEGHRLIITHGNGPQVGNLLLQQKAADSEKNPALPVDSCVAMTQGSIGFWLQNALREALIAHDVEKQVVSLVTQVQVDENDPAFENPSKPIGPFLSEEEAREEMEKGNGIFKEDAGRGWRKVVPSPKPKSILEYPVVETLINADVVTISAGGGGIPVVTSENGFQGIEAVIDKDFAAAKLAELVGADYLIILTGVSNVFINWNKPDQKKLEEVTVEELREYVAQGQFAPGSMLPKVEAAIQFVENAKDGKAIITSLENADKLFSGSGDVTTVVK